jgi:hypothetical protein
MAFLLIAVAASLIFFGRADQAAAWLLPSVPPQIGALALLTTLFLAAALIIPPTRGLATIAITAIFTSLLYAARAVATVSLSAIHGIFRLGLSAWRALWD